MPQRASFSKSYIQKSTLELAYQILRVKGEPVRDAVNFRNTQETARGLLLDLGELTDCGCCGCLHPKDFAGDCRDDNNRF